MVKITWLAVLCCMSMASAAMAAGKETPPSRVRLGPVYRITEPDMLVELQDKLKAMKADGSLQKLQDQAVANGLRSMARPTGMSLPRADRNRTWTHDPTYVVPYDIADHEGRKFAHAGDRINPLERGVSLRSPLLFLDADDPLQAKALPQLLGRWPTSTPKVILVNGDWQAVTRQINRQVFFDQRGTLVKTFGISAVPAVVEQAGSILRVTEILLKEQP